jgi:hypothetical protein
MTLLDREALTRELDRAEEADDWPRAAELRYRLRTICSRCGREEAEDHYDRQGIYAGRWHARCATADDRHRENYRWNPAEDEPLEED